MSNTKPTAFILDAHLKSSLAAIRSLGRHDVKVAAGSHRTTAMGLYSKYVDNKVVYSSPHKNPGGYFDDLVSYWKTRPDEQFLVYYFSDSTFTPLYKRLDLLPVNVKLFLPPIGSVKTAFDKRLTVSLAQKLNIPTPETFFINSQADMEKISKYVSYPVVVKPVSSFFELNGQGMTGAADFALSSVELRDKAVAMEKKFGQWPLVQARVSGQEYGVEGLCQQGELSVYNAHQRLRSLSPRGGASVVKKIIIPPADILNWSKKILEELVWQGPAMVEWKYDEKNRQFVLLEINGRWWGSLPLSILAGCDYPWLYYQLVMGNSLAARPQAKAGIVSRHWWGDLNNLLQVLFKTDPMRSYLYPTDRQALRDFFSCTGYLSDVFDPTDIWPAVVEPLDIINNKLR